MRAKTYSRATRSRLSPSRNNKESTHSVATNGVPPSISISLTLLRRLLLRLLPQPSKSRLQVSGANCGRVSPEKRTRLRRKPRHLVRANVLEVGRIHAGGRRAGGMTGAVMAVARIAEPILIRIGAGARTIGLTRNPEPTGRAKIAVTLSRVINRRDVLVAAEAARAASAMETGSPNQIRPRVPGIRLGTFQEIRRLPRQAPLLPRTLETRRPEPPGKRVPITLNLGGTNE